VTGAAAARRAVIDWLGTLDEGRRARATFPFEGPERFVWQYTPGLRSGLSLGDMDHTQRAAAWAVADVALSARAASEVRAIVDLEPILGELERRTGRTGFPRRDPERYWFAVFGDPGADDGSPWAWRLGGHHVAVNLAVIGDRLITGAPSFLGANPATVPDGTMAGRRALDGEERLARALLDALSAGERGVAIVDPVAPPDIHSGHGRRAALGRIPIGIRHDDLSPVARSTLEALIRHYVDRSRADLAEAAWSAIHTDLGAATFAWAGPTTPGRGHYYAVLGPRFLIEYDNTQDDANHIHSVWRDLLDDWGEDSLRAHYRAAHGAG
jgi:hypothetical protein